MQGSKFLAAVHFGSRWTTAVRRPRHHLQLAFDSVDWIINFVGPQLHPGLSFCFTTIMAAGELVFMVRPLLPG